MNGGQMKKMAFFALVLIAMVLSLSLKIGNEFGRQMAGLDYQQAMACMARDPQPGSLGTYPMVVTAKDQWGRRRVDFHLCVSAGSEDKTRIGSENIIAVDYVMLYDSDELNPTITLTNQDPDFSIWRERLDSAVKR
jgi:hypothetical protein